VPQGFILGPLLFIVYINDLPNIIDSCNDDSASYLFADDLGLKVANKNKDHLYSNTLNNTSKIEDWCAANNLSINSTKTEDITLSFDRKINDINSIKPKFLGVRIDTNLTWKCHIG